MTLLHPALRAAGVDRLLVLHAEKASLMIRPLVTCADWTRIGRLSALTLALTVLAGRGAPGASPKAIDFNRDVRPILSENCFACHGQDASHRKADLRLDVREAAVEAEAIVPGDVEASLLVERIMSDEPSEQMPPPKSNRVLKKEQKETLKRWIAEGAKYQAHWAFVTPVRPEPPVVREPARVTNAIDPFVLAKLDETRLTPAPEADRATLIRRLSLDLVGLSPSAEDVE